MHPVLRGEKFLIYFACLNVGMLVISNFLAGAKMVQLGPLIISGGTIVFPLSYVVNDVLADVYGWEKTKKVIFAGFVVLGIASFCTWLVQVLPAAPGWENQEAYEKILGQIIRINIASLFAVLAGSLTNAYIVAKLKSMGDSLMAKGFRYVLSTAVAEGVDTFLFITIAFLGVMKTETVISALLWQWAFKTGWEMMALPISLSVAKYVEHREFGEFVSSEVEDNDTVGPQLTEDDRVFPLVTRSSGSRLET